VNVDIPAAQLVRKRIEHDAEGRIVAVTEENVDE
jgi:hypothetical protein